MNKPKCPCWENPATAQEREQLVDMLGNGFMEMMRVNAAHWNFCTDSIPYLSGALLAGMVHFTAQCGIEDDRPPTESERLAALDAIIDLARARLIGARALDLDTAEAAGRA